MSRQKPPGLRFNISNYRPKPYRGSHRKSTTDRSCEKRKIGVGLMKENPPEFSDREEKEKFDESQKNTFKFIHSRQRGQTVSQTGCPCKGRHSAAYRVIFTDCRPNKVSSTKTLRRVTQETSLGHFRSPVPNCSYYRR